MLLMGLLCWGTVLATFLTEGTDESGGEETRWWYDPSLTMPSSVWILPGFTAIGWATGLMPFHNSDLTNGTRLAGMEKSEHRLCLLKPFVVRNPAAVTAMELRVTCRGGWVAWLNGVEVVRFNMTLEDSGLSARVAEGLSESEATQEHVLPIPTPSAYLYPGANVLALQAAPLASPEEHPFLIHARITVQSNEKPPRIAAVIPDAGTTVGDLKTVEVFFDQQVTGVDINDLQANGSYATSFREVSPVQFIYGFTNLTPGPVSLTWIVDHGICGKIEQLKLFEAENWSYLLDPALSAARVMINEFMAVNQDSYADEDGDYGDWIELRNGGSGPVNLDGWYLTDNPTNLTRWRLPNYTLLPEDYLVIHASGKDRALGNHPLHANFKLNTEGEYLALIGSDGKTIVSEFSPQYPVQQRNRSCGRAEGDPDSVVFFDKPTPGKPNPYRGAGFAPEIAFSRPSGAFRDNFLLSLEPMTAGAVIYYTLDDTIPTLKSAHYEAPLLITNTTIIRARAFKEDGTPGPPCSACYVALNPTTRGFRSDLPVVLLQKPGPDRVPKTEYQSVYAMLWEPDQGVTRLDHSVQLESRAGIRLRGTSTASDPKRSLNLEWRDEYGRDLDLSTLGMPSDSDWALLAPRFLEPIMIHNPFMFQLSNDIGRYAPRTRFVELFYHSGEGPLLGHDYQGIYILAERIKRGKHRVAINKIEPWHQEPPELTGDYLLKLDHLDPGEWGMKIGRLPAPVLWDDPDEAHMLLPQWKPQRDYIRDYLNLFDETLNGADWRDPAIGYAQFIDLESWIDHHLLNVLAYNIDALGLSTYFHKAQGGKLVFGPIWDFDRALGSRDGHDANPRSWVSANFIPSSLVFQHPWWEPLFRDPDFWQRYGDRWQALRDGAFSTHHLFTLVDRLAGALWQAQPREVRRWPFSMSPLHGSYSSEVEALKTWLTDRLSFIDEHFVDRPRFSLPSQKVMAGFSLLLKGPAGASIYYTVDGSDPREPGGGIAASALLYTNALRLTASAQFQARIFEPEHRHEYRPGCPPLHAKWSGLVSERYEIAPNPDAIGIRINECFLDLKSPEPVRSSHDLEGWIELYNSSTNAVDLEGYRMAGCRTPDQAFVFGEGIVLATSDYLRIKMLEARPSTSGDGRLNALPLDLSQGGDVVILQNPEETVVDAVEFRPQWNGCSLGRWPDGSEDLVHLMPPTPEAANKSAGMSLFARITSWTYLYDGSVILTWESVPGLEYGFECRENGENSSWISLPHRIIAKGAATSFTLPLSEHRQREIRVVVEPQTPTILGLESVGDGYLRLSWQAIPGWYYRLERTPDCVHPIWEPGNYLVKANRTNESLSILMPDTKKRFYRLRLVE